MNGRDLNPRRRRHFDRIKTPPAALRTGILHAPLDNNVAMEDTT
jgi:hypothetical protein